jgi:hypothetical protein
MYSNTVKFFEKFAGAGVGEQEGVRHVGHVKHERLCLCALHRCQLLVHGGALFFVSRLVHEEVRHRIS